ncbi:MAG: xanthine dehydrogenase accessory protein XdhC [Paracoccaceae bacterium]|nr:xanthine dehydrogenase accessory protein XdhC [Paracoccaceae bacterium]
MGFELTKLQELVAQHGKVARVVIAEVQGSSPREVGAAMLVWQNGQSGTIGGGALKLQASQAALKGDRVSRHALGPELGQCCGGAVTLVTEVFDAQSLLAIEGTVFARGSGNMPLAVSRILAAARGEGTLPAPQMIDGWFVEPVETPTRPLWIWGAGHVGRALISVLNPLPELQITWIDTSAGRFPDLVSEGVNVLYHADPQKLIVHAPNDAEHLILTYSHALDLEICHGLLSHGFDFAGLIGSKTKWARFRSRLAQLGHSSAQIERITCPIGQTELGKHPQAIAVGVAAALLKNLALNQNRKDRVA